MEQDNTHLDSAEDRGKDDEGEYPVIPYQGEPRNNEELNGGGGKYSETRLLGTVCKRVLIITELNLMCSLCTELHRLLK